MNWHKFALAGVAGAAVGAAAIHGLHAQVKPPAYLVIEVDVTDPDLYKEYTAKAGPLYRQVSRFIVQGGKVEPFAGDPPKRAVIAVFDDVDKAREFRDSAAYKELIPVRDKSSKYRGYIVEGLTNK